jgi:hypothetical protein
MSLRYSSGMPVFEAALSKNSLTYSKNLGSSKSSSFGPKFLGSTAGVFVVKLASSIEIMIRMMTR